MSDAVLEEAKQNLVASFAVSEAWIQRQAHMRDAIATFNTAQEAVLWAQHHTNSGFDHREAVKGGLLIEGKDRLIRERFPKQGALIDALEDSPFSRPDTLLSYQGRRVSNIHYWHLNQMLACLEWLDPKPTRILEIGGGYGALARLFKLAIGSVQYVIVDLPESLFFAECFLRLNFPRSVFVRGSFGFPNSFSLVPITPLPRLTMTYDLAVQSGGFQEMPEDTVRGWMEWLATVLPKGALGVRGLYSLNYGTTPIVGKEPDGGYADWSIVHREENPPVVAADAGSNWAELCLLRKYPVLFGTLGTGSTRYFALGDIERSPRAQ